MYNTKHYWQKNAPPGIRPESAVEPAARSPPQIGVGRGPEAGATDGAASSVLSNPETVIQSGNSHPPRTSRPAPEARCRGAGPCLPRPAGRRGGLPFARLCAPSASMREQICDSRRVCESRRACDSRRVCDSSRQNEGDGSRYALVAEVVGPVVRGTGPHQGEGSRRGEKGVRCSCGDGWDCPWRPARPPEERTVSPYADASAATTADRFHSRRGLHATGPLDGDLSNRSAGPSSAGPSSAGPSPAGIPPAGPPPAERPPSGWRPSASTSRCGRQMVGTTGIASRRLAQNPGGSFPLRSTPLRPPRMTGNVERQTHLAERHTPRGIRPKSPVEPAARSPPQIGVGRGPEARARDGAASRVSSNLETATQPGNRHPTRISTVGRVEDRRSCSRVRLPLTGSTHGFAGSCRGAGPGRPRRALPAVCGRGPAAGTNRRGGSPPPVNTRPVRRSAKGEEVQKQNAQQNR
jgi:hypothetical protein